MKRVKREVAARRDGQGKAVRDASGIQGPLGQVLSHAVQVKASDVHIEQWAGDKATVRYRIDGVLKEEGPKLTHAECVAATAEAKRLAGLELENLGVPQAGRIMFGDAGVRELLVSVAPCVGSTSMVVHVLGDVPAGLQHLNPGEPVVSTLRRWLGLPHGVIIASGCTGSGKTTTLLALLQELNMPALKIVTIEEPVFYRIAGVSHIEVDPRKGIDYATAVKCAEAQDADVVLVGEVWDAETAGVTLRAALGGRLALTSMHAINCSDALARLRDMGIAPKFISEELIGVTNQRLMRRVCDKCKEPYAPTAMETETMLKGKTDGTFYQSKGCDACRNTGYRGRVAAYELLQLDNAMRALILQGASAEELCQQARESGCASLRDAALAKAEAGITTLNEVLRCTPPS